MKNDDVRVYGKKENEVCMDKIMREGGFDLEYGMIIDYFNNRKGNSLVNVSWIMRKVNVDREVIDVICDWLVRKDRLVMEDRGLGKMYRVKSEEEIERDVMKGYELSKEEKDEVKKRGEEVERELKEKGVWDEIKEMEENDFDWRGEKLGLKGVEGGKVV